MRKAEDTWDIQTVGECSRKFWKVLTDHFTTSELAGSPDLFAVTFFPPADWEDRLHLALQRDNYAFLTSQLTDSHTRARYVDQCHCFSALKRALSVLG
jgi:hypothetical protein